MRLSSFEYRRSESTRTEGAPVSERRLGESAQSFVMRDQSCHAHVWGTNHGSGRRADPRPVRRHVHLVCVIPSARPVRHGTTFVCGACAARNMPSRLSIVCSLLKHAYTMSSCPPVVRYCVCHVVHGMLVGATREVAMPRLNIAGVVTSGFRFTIIVTPYVMGMASVPLTHNCPPGRLGRAPFEMPSRRHRIEFGALVLAVGLPMLCLGSVGQRLGLFGVPYPVLVERDDAAMRQTYIVAVHTRDHAVLMREPPARSPKRRSGGRVRNY